MAMDRMKVWIGRDAEPVDRLLEYGMSFHPMVLEQGEWISDFSFIGLSKHAVRKFMIDLKPGEQRVFDLSITRHDPS